MHVSESSGDFVGRLWTVSDGNQPTRSSLLSTNSSVWAPCNCVPFLKTNATVNRHKEATYFIYVSKVWWKEDRKEGVGHITLSAGWYHSILADQFSQTEGDEKGASARRRGETRGGEGWKEELKWWSYWFVKEIQHCVFCLNVHINLSCQGWAGAHWHLATQMRIVDFLLGFAARTLSHQHLAETGVRALVCFVACPACEVHNQLQQT